MLEVSVVIPAYNEEKTVIDLLNNLYINSIRKPNEIILVDANSVDKTVDLAKKWKEENKECNLKIIELKSKAYPGKARNIGVKNASFAYIAFIDCGIIPAKDWLSKLMRPFQRDEQVEVVWGLIYSKAETAWENAFTSIVERKKIVRAVPNSCIRKEVFYKIGMFREDLRAAEDLFYKQVIAKNNIKEAFSDAEAWYTGYPMSYIQAFKKWVTYSQNDVCANTYIRKLFLVLIEVLVFLSVFAVSIIFLENIVYIPIGILLLLILRVLMSVRKSSTTLRSLREFLMAIGISISIDLGRLVGLIVGLIKYKLFCLND
jgi:glycosyltransferase involved in cell wall biosynthesis